MKIPTHASRWTKGRSLHAGFSLLELCIVLAVMLVAVGTSVQLFVTAVQHYRLRTAGKNVAAMLQNARMRSVRDNQHYSVLQQQVILGSTTYDQMFLDQNGNGSYDGGEAMMQLPLGVRFNAAAAPALPATTLGYTPQPASTPISFNGMGAPCVVRSGICSNWDSDGNAVGAVYFLQDARASSSWVAVSLSPAGRVRTWRWSASSSLWLAQ